MGHLRRSSMLSFLLVSLSCPLVFGQAPKPAPYTIQKLVFQGQTPYSQAALEAASGLKVGSPLSDADLRAAAERLINTGAFGDVGASLDGPAKSISVIFKVQPAGPEHLARASFDNFVWFSREELSSELQKRVPLFNGSVPEGGNVQDAVEGALKQMLTAKGVEAKVSSQLVGPHPGQPFRMAEYHVEAPSIELHRLEIAGVPPGFTAATDKVVHALIGSPYSDGLMGGLSERVLADYRNAGYQEAALTGLKSTVVSSGAARVTVDVTATLQPGEVYRVSKLAWAGSPQMTAAAFTAAAKLQPGDVASEQALLASVENLDAAYRNQGYMDVIVDAAPKLDRAAHQVAYTVSAIPGPQYKLRELTVQGLTPAQRKEFDSAWKLHAGDVYNAGYVKSFLTSNTALQTLASLKASFKANEDPEAGALDLDILFVKGAAK
jgi:outer membrane protein assembly factor BamA